MRTFTFKAYYVFCDQGDSLVEAKYPAFGIVN